MFLTEKKLRKRIEELDIFRYVIQDTITQFDVEEEDSYSDSKDNRQTVTAPFNWKGWDKYLHLRVEVNIPVKSENREPVGVFDFGLTGAGNNSGFESLLYINGSPYQGVDSNHREVFFNADQQGKKLNLTFRLWSGLDGMEGKYEEQEHQIQPALIGYLDKQTDELYFMGKAVLETIEVMEENNPLHSQLLSLLNQAYGKIDWRTPGSEKFYHSVYTAGKHLQKGLEGFDANHPVTITGIGHTHIDVAWLWRLKHTREKCARSFSTVLRLMEKYPEYTFLQTQPQLYEYVKSDYPKIYDQIKERVQEQRWEAGGAMWLESDANLPSGESLIRQLLYGQNFFQKEFGKSEMNYLWLPDVFGYSWALPQILKKSGIDVFMTTKISWNQYNRMPHDTFIWRGIDGSEILTHFITTPDDGRRYTYNGQINATALTGIWEEYRDKPVNQDLLLAYGYGDGGGGVTRDMLEMRRSFNKIPGIPKVTTGRADDYFTKLKKTLENTEEYVHTWDGELYLEYHRGTYTSQAYNKLMNRRLELLYREAEILDVIGGIEENLFNPERQKLLHDGWKIILRNQFHDIIPGSSIREVYEDSALEYKDAETLGMEAVGSGYSSILNPAENVYSVFNSASWKQSGLVWIQGEDVGRFSWKAEDGRELLVQQSKEGCWIKIDNIPSLGFTRITCERKIIEEKQGKITFGRNSVHSPFYDVEWDDKTGHLKRIFDKTYDREVLSSKKGNVFQVFEDKPIDFDAWDIDIFYQEKCREVSKLESLDIETGPLKTSVNFKWRYEHSTISQRMELYEHNRRIDFKTTVDWNENNQLLKVLFPVDIRATEAVYDIQFGNVKRPTHWNTSWDMARFETVGHQWADLSERNYGISLMNDCKYGYDIKNNELRLTLIKSAVKPDARQDQGRHDFTYSLFPHKGDWYEGGTVEEAWFLNNPLKAVQGQAVTTDSLFQVTSQNIMIDAVKVAENTESVIIRVHEYSGQKTPMTIKSAYPINSWQECTLLEEDHGTRNKGDHITDELGPYEIKTYRVSFAK
jgi:alpha-mannosidase